MDSGSPEVFLSQHGTSETFAPSENASIGERSAAFSAKLGHPLFWTDSSNDWSEADIPKRQWIATEYLMRGTLSVLVGVPGASKSTLALAWAVALALGEPFHRLRPIRDSKDSHGARKRVLVVNTEDDGDEQRRRISALLRQFERIPRDLDGWLMRAGPEHVATLVEKDASSGTMKPSAGFAALQAIIGDFRPDVLILDPMVELFGGIDENSNADASAALSELRGLAHEHRMAIMLVHHCRKGAVQPGDMDAARGASSLHGKVRQGLTLVGMSEEEAGSLGLPLDARRNYLRLDEGKNSYAPLHEAQWFERHSILLDNGDTAPTLIPWATPKDTITPEVRSLVEAGIARGSSDGPWSSQMSNKPRSIKQLMTQAGVTTGDGMRRLMSDLEAAGYALNVKFHHAGTRKIVSGIRCPSGKPSAEWRDDALPK